jgi:uncharacterized membrane protein YdbT with pleckstrin-like domain
LEIESKARTYFHFRYPFFYYIQFISLPIVSILWLFGVVLGIYFFKAEKTFSTLFWITAWILAGLFIYYWGIWYKCGRQIIEVENKNIRVTKKFILYRRTKVLPTNRIKTIEYKELKPFNVFTGKEIKIKPNMGWLIINGDSNYYINSYLYPVEDLKALIKCYNSNLNVIENNLA